MKMLRLQVLRVSLLALLGIAACGGEDKSFCDQCGPGQVCVQLFDGTCHSNGPACVDLNLTCLPNTCSAECQAALCPSPYQCENRAPCGGELAEAFNCYGP